MVLVLIKLVKSIINDGDLGRTVVTKRKKLNVVLIKVSFWGYNKKSEPSGKNGSLSFKVQSLQFTVSWSD